ncbi:bacterial transcriptional activator domain-containing protein [Streptosporangiaceae bacterium NEAU-GS5]|nr:bacterial transcriptional activator domain-containing protein [Streptosporangiaceae bacterium NEAU-GS5]
MPAIRPVEVKVGRTAGDVLAGLLAVVALGGLLAGVPYALLRFFGSPIPAGGFSLSALTGEVGLSTVLDLLSILVWLAWAQLAACVLVELYAGVRKIGVPRRVPFAGGTQAVAHRLVTAALLLFTAAATVTPLISAVAPAKPATSSMSAVVSGIVQAERQEDPAPLAPVHKTKKVYVVQPPEGRHHESLWEIADKCLGEGRRYKEIYRLNEHKTQPDGSRLRMADLIRPGWVLDMPDDAVNVHVVPIGEGRDDILHQHHDKPAELDGHTHYEIADQSPATDVTQATETRSPDARSNETHPYSRPKHAAPELTPAQDTGAEFGLPDYLAAASLVSAGLLAALGRRRREQLWSRAFGRRLPDTTEGAALAEVAMLLGSDVAGTRLLDIGLRHLSRALGAQGRTPPTVYGAFLAPGRLDLWIHPADRDAPAPWVVADGGQVWRLTSVDARQISEADLTGVLAPYPGLVSLGAGQGGRVLVDLEAAHGIVNLRGRAHVVTAALAAVAAELATNRWSDHMRLVLVGFGADLTLIAPDRITAVGTLAEALPELEARTADVRRALAAAGADSVLTGRARGVYGEAWMPTYLLSAVPPTPQEAARLSELAKTGTRLASGYLIAGDELPTPAWTWDLTPDGRASIPALGLEADGQLLPEQQYEQVIELFRATTRDGVPLPEPEPNGPAAAQLHPSFRPAVEVRILGGVEVVAPGPVEEERVAACAELVAYLAAHPEGVHPMVLGGALWPKGVEASVRDSAIARVRTWLGADGTGRPNLIADADGRLRLGPAVQVDWWLFQELIRPSGGASHASADPHDEAARLGRALALVRGPLAERVPRGRYGWLATGTLAREVPARVGDAAHRLSDLRLNAGDAKGAAEAALSGLRGSADDETLWRDLLRAAHASGDPATLRHWIGIARQRAAVEFGGRMAPETEALIEELHPAVLERAAG